MLFSSHPLLKKMTAFCLLAFILTQTTACSFFASKKQTITVNSDPQGAKVMINGEFVGPTPAQYRIKRNEEASIMVTKEGYQTVTRHTSKSLSGVGILDIVGGCIWLVPFFGLLSAGAWEQDQNNFSVVMSK